MDARKHAAGAVAPALNYEDFDPSYDQVQEPQVDTLLLYLPGFAKDQLRVQLTGSGILKISGQRRLEGDNWLRFLKQFPVSSNCDTNRISAKFESGILYITQPKLIIPAEKPADVTEQKTKEAEPSKKAEDSGSESEPGEPTKPENASDKKGVDPASRTGPGEQTKPDNASRTGPGEQTKPDNASDKKAANDKRAVSGKSDGAKSGAGKAAKMDGYSDNAAAETAQLKRSRKMMNVALVILLVVGVGLYLKNKMRSSSNEAGEL